MKIFLAGFVFVFTVMDDTPARPAAPYEHWLALVN